MIRLWPPWRWFRRKPKELPPPEEGDAKKLPPPDAAPEFAPYAIPVDRTDAVTAPDTVAASLPPPVEPITPPVITTPPVIEASAEPVPPVIEAAVLEPPLLPEDTGAVPPELQPPQTIDASLSLPAPLASPRGAQHADDWIRDRAKYFSSGRYAPARPGAESFLAPDLLFRLG